MLYNYLTIALRNLWRNKTFSAINILGLAISIATCLLLVLFIVDELRFDQYHEKKSRIYRLTGVYDQGGEEKKPSALTNFGLAPLLQNEFPFIQNIVRVSFGEFVIKQNATTYLEKKVCVADSGFFDLFSFRFVQGNPRTALLEPNTVVLTQATAQKYFGQETALGKTLQVADQPVKVTGVIEEVPQNSHFHFDLLLSGKTVERGYEEWMRDPQSGGVTHYTYLLLPDNYQPQQLQAQLGGFVKKYIGQNSKATLQLQPLTHIHLRSNLSSEIEANGSLTYV